MPVKYSFDESMTVVSDVSRLPDMKERVQVPFNFNQPAFINPGTFLLKCRLELPGI